MACRPYERNFVPIGKDPSVPLRTKFSSHYEPFGIVTRPTISKKVDIPSMMASAQQRPPNHQSLPAFSTPFELQKQNKTGGISMHYDVSMQNGRPSFPALRGLGKENLAPKKQAIVLTNM